MKKRFSIRFIKIMLAIALTTVSVLNNYSRTQASTSDNKVTLNGLVDQNSEGFINSKAVMVGDTNSVVKYNLVPNWLSGSAFRTRVHIKLPSMNHIDGEYVYAENNGEVGIKGTVVDGGGWLAIGDKESNGGLITMEYTGSLSAGNNPSFDISLSTYTNDPNLSLPEGTNLELKGYVSYDNFNGMADSGWITPGNDDENASITVVASNLKWDAALGSVFEEGETVDTVPIWDRYQYISYDYEIENTSDNVESFIDGFTTTFIIDSEGTELNGIIPFDINRFSYIDGEVVPNTDPDLTEGLFIGVEGEGGILIYDITDSEELDTPLPYTYSGTGMIEISRPDLKISPKESRTYRIILPLSRQGFPNVPTLFKISTITNIFLGGGINWTKTHVNQREIVTPSFEMRYDHRVEQNDVIYGFETFFEISNIVNKSNVPVFDPVINYHKDEDFKVTSIELKLPIDQSFEDVLKSDFLTYIDSNDIERSIGLTTETSTDELFHYLKIDLSDVKEGMVFHLKDTLEKKETLDLVIKIFGEPYRVGEMSNSSELVFIEKQASNDEFGENTTYTDVPHYVENEQSINVLFPNEVVSSHSIAINGSKTQDKNNIYQGTGQYDQLVNLDYYFGTNNEEAESSVFEAILNEDLALHEPEIIIKKELFDFADDIKIYYVDRDNNKISASYTFAGEDVPIKLRGVVKKVIIETQSFKTNGEEHLVSIISKLNKGTSKSHSVSSSFSTYQPMPYDKISKASANGLITIELPNELDPQNIINVYYGNTKSNNVSYESVFDVDFTLNTKGVTSPNATYVIELMNPSKTGFLEIQELELDETYVSSYISYDRDGNSYKNQVPFDKEISKIELVLKNFNTNDLTSIAKMKAKAQIEMGSSQDIKGTFIGDQDAPYGNIITRVATEKVTVFDTKTSVTVRGVNQVNEGTGVGNKYSVDIHQYWYYNYANNVNDYTLDQGYKSLGGFTLSMERPTQKYANNDQNVTLTTNLPNHFDMYYLKIRDDAKEYINRVDIYRTIDGQEVLWQSVDGSKWVNNTAEGNFWRINTALESNNGDNLFSSFDTTEGVYEHPYFKSAWHEEVRPNSPVTKVEVVLDFERLSNDDIPQLAGKNENLIEYMGRFHSTSSKKEATPVQSLDKLGKVEVLEREHKHTINSLVGYSYAQSNTGAHDTTTLSRKQVLMGTVGEYKASILNMENYSDPYYRGQGPDIYTPVATEHNEWIHLRNSGFFHDTLIYEFIYPTLPSKDSVYNYDSQYFVIENTPVNKYLDKIIIYGENNNTVTIDSIDFEGAVKVNYINGSVPGYEIVDNEINVTLGTDIKALRFEAYFKKIQGFGERTSEIDGTVQDTLGSGSLVDVRIGGIVNGDKDLKGITNLYRLPDDSTIKKLVHESSATLTGITPKLNAQMTMKFDNVKVYDYGSDGVTPNRTVVEYDLSNKGEADITDIVMYLSPDSNFRSEEVRIPKEIFTGDYSVDSVLIDGVEVKDSFSLVGDFYTLNIVDLFKNSILSQTTYTKGGITYNKLDVRKISVSFRSNVDDARLYGQFTKNEKDDQTLPSRLIDGSYIYVSGVWADQSTSGEWDWDSIPSYVGENTKGRSEVITSYSSFNVSAEVTSKQSIFVSSGNGNQGQKPSLTYTSNLHNASAPRLYNRGAKLSLISTHLDQDLTVSNNNNIFFDIDTNKHINYANLTVGDTNFVLYQIKNSGILANDNEDKGDIPVFNPYFELEIPKGLKVKESKVLTNKPDFIEDDLFVSARIATENLLDKKYQVTFDNTLQYGESVYLLIEFETINDFSGDLNATQNKTIGWKAYARPYKVHNFHSFDAYGQNSLLINGTNNTSLDGNYYASSYNTLYKFANPVKLKTLSHFKEENVSGKEMTFTVTDISNETLHSNTQVELFLKLDKNKEKLVEVQGNSYGGFELTDFPRPETMEGYLDPRVYFLFEENWILSDNFDKNIHDMKDINELKVDYGIVADDFVAPNFIVEGIGHWKTLGALNSKSYNIYSTAQIVLTHDNNSSYQFTTESYKTVYKAIAQTELNLQAFETKEEAIADYNGSIVGKHSYKPNDSFYYKLSLLNLSNFQGVNTNTPYGKADFLNPVIYDKIPEYISIEDVEIRIIDIDKNSRTFIAPKIIESTITGLDVGGNQSFSNDRHNDAYGLLSSAHPSDTSKNSASSISYKLIEYHFENEELKRGERIEIVYKATARKEKLPFSHYPDDRAVYAPFLGWYGDNNPNAGTTNNLSMDMASLLHDVGVSGNKGHELTHEEFLSNSSSWTHGSNDSRKVPSYTNTRQTTYYDESANKQKTHRTWMKEEEKNNLYVSFTGSLDEVFNFVTNARVNDGQVTSKERIMWAQNGMQLQRAWLYGASEIRPDVLRRSNGTDSVSLEDAANFYEHDGNLNSSALYPWNNYGLTPYAYDDYTYAVELYEEFTIRLHAANLGDRSIEHGLKYTEILPIGVTPYDEEGNILGISTKNGVPFEYTVIQTPSMDKGYRAPAQSQEAGTYGTATRSEIPYVVEIKVSSEIYGAFNTSETDNKQYVDLRVRVESMIDPNEDVGVNKNLALLHDELTITPLGIEEYLEVYSKEYGAYTRSLSQSYDQNSKYYLNDAVSKGLDLSHSWVSPSTYLSFEPYGMYIRGLNAQNTRTESLGLVTGDQIALRKPTLRTWINPEKLNKKDDRYGNIDNFDLNLYDEVRLHATIENQQLEVLQGYNRSNYGYNSTYSNEDLWKNAPQTIGGARGTYFDPSIKMTLPKGIAPVAKDGSVLRPYHSSFNEDIDFEATIYDISDLHTTELNRVVSDFFDVSVSFENDQFTLTFTVNKTKSSDVKYLQTLIISPKVKVIDMVDGNVEIYATSSLEGMNPIVSELYKTGSVPSTSSRDTDTIHRSINGKIIAENDRLRPDSTSTWNTNMGVLKITDQLIKETVLTDTGVHGALELKVRQATINNTTKTLVHPYGSENEVSQVDPAGKHWYLTELKNNVLPHENPYEESHGAGDIHHSRFVFTYLITDFAQVTKNVRIKVGNDVFKPEERGYEVQYITTEEFSEGRNRVQFIVTPPNGTLLAQDSFKFMFEVILVDGFNDDTVGNEDVWTGDTLKVDSYIAIISDDVTVSSNDVKDFVIQDPSLMNYNSHVQRDDLKFNQSGDLGMIDYAHSESKIEILKPKVEIRKNTLKPRIEYTSGQTGDNYYNSSDDIIYAINHFENMGAGLKELIMEEILPTHEQTESSIDITRLPITTRAQSITSGIWHIPQETLDNIERDGKDIHDVFRVYVYASSENAVDGYETDNWTLLNPNGSSIYTNDSFTLERDTRKIRVVLRAIDNENYLIPKGTKLAIDTDPSTPELESVLDSDPNNLNIHEMADSVFNSSIQITMRALSDASSTLFIYNHAQAWANYVGDSTLKITQSKVRSYLTPSRPVLNVIYEASNFRITGTDENGDFNYGWSDNTNINPHQLPHLKFKSEFINADETMWSEDEKQIYAKDLLIDPFISFELPKVMSSLQDKLKYVDSVDENSPLHPNYDNKQGLLNSDSGLWTWRLEKKDGSQSEIELKDIYTGSWNGFSNNVINIWFKGQVEPGDKIVVEFIGAITFFAVPNTEDLRSKAKISNNTGLLTPLNSLQNSSNKLGYTVDSYDLDRNQSTSNRLVFQDKSLFSYENVDNFKKSKKAISELNLAGTEYPELTPMKQNGIVTFETTIDNSQLEENRTYPYPIFYDVLPHIGDTSIFNNQVERNSKFNPLLLTDSIKLEIEGSDTKVFNENDYTTYVGPFQKIGNTITKVDLPEGAGTEKFYDDLGLPGKTSPFRDQYFVSLQDFKKYAVGRDAEIDSILVLFNNAIYEMPANSKIRLSYDMKSLINAPVMLDSTSNKEDYAILNSFSATQRVAGFKPQESNMAGAYTTEMKENSYFGGYIWHDYNINGIKDEGTLWTDSNGRELLKPDLTDYGINGVKVRLQTEKGFDVDQGGFAIKQDIDDLWYVVDEETGEFLIEETFLKKILSSGPLVTETESDYHGNAGYYVFSNIPKRVYKVVYEFDEKYDKFGQTTQNTKEVKDDGLVSIIERLDLTELDNDSQLMSYDIGIANQVVLGGNIFLEKERIVSGKEEQFNGIKDSDESGIAEAQISLKDVDGTILKDINGKDYIVESDADGNYEFVITPLMRNAYLSVVAYPTDPIKQKSTVISPIRINTNPFAESNDNDGYYVRSDKETRSDNLSFALDDLYAEGFSDRTSVYFGFYERSNTATIGDKVWNDLNQNGIQDIGEPGIENQKLLLHQYALIDEKYELVEEGFKSTETNTNGLYYFTKVPTMVEVSGAQYPAYYKVSIKELVKGYNISLNNQGSIETDNNFLLNGLMREDDFIEIIGKDEDGNFDEYEPIDVNNVDLGLHAHQLGSLQGSLFEDTNEDGFNNDMANTDAYPGFFINLEVKDANGNWVNAQKDANGIMLEPGIKGEPIQVFGKDYLFENLMIVNPEPKADGSYVLFEYRVVVSQVPQWFDVAQQFSGGDLSINNDFKERDIKNNNFRTLETETITLKVSKTDDSLVAVETFTPVNIENIDFGLIPLDKTRNISGTLWIDGIIYDLDTKEYILDLDKRNGILDSEEPLRLSDTNVYLYRKDVDKKILRPVLDEDGVHIQTITDDKGFYEFKNLDLIDYDIADPNSDNFDPNWRYYNEAIEYVVSFDRKTRHEASQYAMDPTKTDSDFIQLTLVDKIDGYEDLDRNYTLYDASGIKVDINQHMLVSSVALLANKNGGKVDYHNTQDVILDAGVIEHDTVKEISGTLFEDLNSNGIQDGLDERNLEGIEASLFVFDFNTNQWTPKLDENGQQMIVHTDKDGHYSFEVEVADMDKTSAHYQKVYRYRVVIEPRFDNEETIYRYTLANSSTSQFEYIESELQGLTLENYYTDLVSKEVKLANEKDGKVDLSSLYDQDLAKLNQSVDAGFNIFDSYILIGGQLWNDEDLNHIRDSKETAISNHEVSLYRKVGSTWVLTEDLNGVSSVMTDSNGEYEFKVAPTSFTNEDKSVWQYRVATKREAWQSFANPNVGTDELIDSDFVNASDLTPETKLNTLWGVSNIFDIAKSNNGIFDINTMRDDLSMDAGIQTFENTVVLAGKMWSDDNFDGIMQENEKGIENREVKLWKFDANESEWSEVEKTMTDQNGDYSFVVEPTNYDSKADDYLVPYEYKISIERKSNEMFSPYKQGLNPELDSNVDNSLNDYKNLRSYSDNFIITETNNGLVEIDKVKSDLQIGIGIKEFETSVLIGGTVWSDTTFDGEMDHEEKRLSGREITLWIKENNQWTIHKDLNGKDTSITDKNGSYSFRVSPTNYDSKSDDYLVPYEYRISIDREGFEAFSPYQNAPSNVDSNIHLSDILGKNLKGVSDIFEIYQTINNTVDITSISDDLDMGIGINTYENLVLIGGNVWEDTNKDGILSDDEPMIQDQLITLWREVADGSWENLGNTISDEDGKYTFTVSPTEYDPNSPNYLDAYVYRVSTEREGFQEFTAYKQGTDTEKDNNIQDRFDLDGVYMHLGISDAFSIYELINNKVDISSVRDDLSMGIALKTNKQFVTLGGVVWFDEDEDGIMLDEEERLSERTVILQKFENDKWEDIDSTLTDEFGEYRFTDVLPTEFDYRSDSYLIPYEYRITYSRNGYEVFSPMHEGSNKEIDSDIDSQSMFKKNHKGISNNFDIYDVLNDQIIIDSVRDDIQMGVGLNIFKSTSLISGILWNDTNKDGIKDQDETLITNRRVELWKHNPIDLNNPMGPGEWTLVEDIHGNTYVDTDENGYYEFEVYPTNYDNEADDYLLVHTYAVISRLKGDEMWNEGLIDAPFFGSLDQLRDFTTKGLPLEDGYGFIKTFNLADYDDEFLVDIRSVRDNESMDGAVFQYNNLATIGDTIWLDSNENGVQDENELGIKDLKIRLQKFDNELNQWIDSSDVNGIHSVHTDQFGKYQFLVEAGDLDIDSSTYLSEHQYRILVEIPEGMKVSSSSVEFTQEGMVLISRTAQLFKTGATLEEIEVFDDLDLDLGLIQIRDPEELVPTGEEFKTMLPISLVLLIGMGYIVTIKRRKYEVKK